MRQRVFVIAGHNQNSPGALGYDGIYEHERNVDLQRHVTGDLSSVTCLQGTSMEILNDDDDKSNAAVRSWIDINRTPMSRGCDIHFNNNNPAATGTEIVISPHTSIENRRRAIWMANNLSRAMEIPLRRRDPRRDYIFPHETFVGRLPIIEDTAIPMILIEVCFLNDRDLPKFIRVKPKVAHIIRAGMVYLSFKEEGSEHQLITLPNFHTKWDG